MDIEAIMTMPNMVQEEGLACRMVLLSTFALMTDGQSPLCLSLVLQVKTCHSSSHSLFSPPKSEISFSEIARSVDFFRD